MRILSISAQKPNSTGSGIYLTELVKAFDGKGHRQAVVAGINPDDNIVLPEGVKFYSVRFKSERLEFPVVGMSDVMPYESTRYCDMTEEMAENFISAFTDTIMKAVEEFKPEAVLCHHLYLATAVARSIIKDIPVVAVCHSTCLRQYGKNALKKDFIAENIRKLDCIVALHHAQAEEIKNIFGIGDERIMIVGAGYNHRIFNSKNAKRITNPDNVRIGFAGKITRDKGVISLFNAVKYIPNSQRLTLELAGGSGNTDEYKEIVGLSEKLPCRVNFKGKLPQGELAELWEKCDIFVLPSFYEGLPLTLIEAMACGCRAVASDWPGVRQWLEQNVPNAEIDFVQLPPMDKNFIPFESELEDFEKRLADSLNNSIETCISGRWCQKDMSSVSWEGIAEKIAERLDNYLSILEEK